MKRILLVANAGSIHTRRWAEHYRDIGVSVHVASFQPGDILDVEVHRLRTMGLGRAGYPLAVPRLRALARTVQPDIVHAHYVTSYGLVAALAGLHPLVVTAWGSDVLLNPRDSAILRWLTRYALLHADAITTVAQHMNSAISVLGIPEDRIRAVPFGVDASKFVMGTQSAKSSERLRLICTRNFDGVYDVATLIRAVELVAGQKESFLVDLVGRGPLRTDLERQVTQSGLSQICSFRGHVDHDRLVDLLGQADVFVSPAISDGNNVSLNEAMACGSFPIATDIPANAQWIEHGVNGLLYAPGDAGALADCIRQAFGDPAIRERARLVNREIVERRASWQVCVGQMDEVYDDAMRRCGATR